MTERYNQLYQVWKKKIERWENNTKRKQRDQKNREIFEKIFPEMRKQREDKEKNASLRVSTRSGSLLSGRVVETENLVNATGDASFDQEQEEKRIRNNAVVPPMLLDVRTRQRLRFENHNGLILDAVKNHNEELEMFHMVWTDSEKQIFKEKFIQYPKNFAAIAIFLERKSTKDCVQYYYLTKKREKYKQLLRRQYKRKVNRQYRPPVMPRTDENQTEANVSEAGAGDERMLSKFSLRLNISLMFELESFAVHLLTVAHSKKDEDMIIHIFPANVF